MFHYFCNIYFETQKTMPLNLSRKAKVTTLLPSKTAEEEEYVERGSCVLSHKQLLLKVTYSKKTCISYVSVYLLKSLGSIHVYLICNRERIIAYFIFTICFFDTMPLNLSRKAKVTPLLPSKTAEEEEEEADVERGRSAKNTFRFLSVYKPPEKSRFCI
jgi:hypothetical protein